MTNRSRTLLLTSPALCALLWTSTACSGGSSGGVSGLSMPSEVSVVGPSTGTGVPAGTAPGALATGIPAGSDFFTDETQVRVYDPALEPLDTINFILCAVGQTRPGEMINQGLYTAQVDVGACRAGESGSSGPGSDSEPTRIALWVVESARASNAVPQTLAIWVPEFDETDGARTIFVDGVIADGTGATRPFGSFALDFATVNDVGGTITAPLQWGTFETTEGVGEIGFTYFQDQGDVDQVQLPEESSRRVQVAVEMSADQTTGIARILRTERRHNGTSDPGPVVEEYVVAFDPDHFLRETDGDGGVLYSRTSFVQNVQRYNLYHAAGPQAGERVELNAGFSFRAPDGVYGWADRQGVWVPEGNDLAAGTTVVRESFDALDGTAYDVFRAPGRLTRYTRDQLPLADVDAEVFHWTTFDAGSGTSTIYTVRYDAGSDLWERFGTFDPASGTVTTTPPAAAIDTSTEGSLSLWSSSLGGLVSYVHGDAFVSVFTAATVDGSDAVFAGGATELELFGLVDCLRSGLVAGDAEAGDVFLGDAGSTSTPYRFEFRQADLTLWHDVAGDGSSFTRVGLADDEVPTSGPYTWGLRSGPLVPSTVGLGSVSDVWNVSEFYVYETGPNPENRFAGLVTAAGDFAAFDAPLVFQYEHELVNDRNGSSAHVGRTFLLEYGGPGDLRGLPLTEVDLNGDGNGDRWYPEVHLADGTLMGPGGVEYVARAIEVEETLAADPSGTTTLTLGTAGTLPLPDGSTYATPGIGARPPVDEAPSVVEGEVVGP